MTALCYVLLELREFLAGQSPGLYRSAYDASSYLQGVYWAANASPTAVQDVRVDHRRPNIFVPEQLLRRLGSSIAFWDSDITTVLQIPESNTQCPQSVKAECRRQLLGECGSVWRVRTEERFT
jgi:hypothetical protein